MPSVLGIGLRRERFNGLGAGIEFKTEGRDVTPPSRRNLGKSV